LIQFSDTEIVGQHLVLDSKTELYYLGHNLTLRDCTIVLRVAARALVIAKVNFINCAIDVKRELRNYPWSGASLKACRVTGKLRGADFGRWKEGGYSWEHASISDCDFSGARLDCCRFHRCDTRTLKFPRWPCFTILDPIANNWKLGGAAWPEVFGDVVIKNLRTHPASTVALTFYAPSMAKLCNTTAEALREVVEKFDCIVY